MRRPPCNRRDRGYIDSFRPPIRGNGLCSGRLTKFRPGRRGRRGGKLIRPPQIGPKTEKKKRRRWKPLRANDAAA